MQNHPSVWLCWNSPLTVIRYDWLLAVRHKKIKHQNQGRRPSGAILPERRSWLWLVNTAHTQRISYHDGMIRATFLLLVIMSSCHRQLSWTSQLFRVSRPRVAITSLHQDKVLPKTFAREQINRWIRHKGRIKLPFPPFLVHGHCFFPTIRLANPVGCDSTNWPLLTTDVSKQKQSDTHSPSRLRSMTPKS